MYQRLSKNGHLEKALKDDPLQEVIMNRRQNNQNGHPFAVPSERSRHEKSVGGRGREGRSDQFLPNVDQRNKRYRSSPSRNGGSFQDDGDESDRRAISLSPASSRKSTGAKSYGSSNSSGSSIAFPPLLTPSPPFSGYNSTGGDGGGRLRTPDMVSAFDDLIRTAVAAYTRASGEIGADVHRQAELVEDLFQSQREFLLSSCRGRAPSAVGTGPDQANKMKGIKALANDRSAHPAHLHYIADTVGCMGWVVMGNKPCVFIRDSYEKGKRHVRDIKAHQKEHSRGKEHTNWVKMWQEVVLDLEAYVAEYHPYGLVWQKG